MTADGKVRLVALYSLRYGRHPQNALALLVDLLGAAGNIPQSRIDLVAKVLQYHSSLQQVQEASSITDMFEAASIFGGARGRLKGLKGVDNVYTQHSPRLEITLQELIKGRLKEQQFPFVEGGGSTRDKPQDIIVFMIGGATYEEAKLVATVNAAVPGIRVVLGGTSIHNSASFLQEVEEATGSWPAPAPSTAAGRLRQETGRR